MSRDSCLDYALWRIVKGLFNSLLLTLCPIMDSSKYDTVECCTSAPVPTNFRQLSGLTTYIVHTYSWKGGDMHDLLSSEPQTRRGPQLTSFIGKFLRNRPIKIIKMMKSDEGDLEFSVDIDEVKENLLKEDRQSSFSVTSPSTNHGKTSMYSYITNLTTTHSDSKMSSILSSLMYTGCSVSMVLANKAIPMAVPLEDRKHLPDTAIILSQCIIAVILVTIAKRLNIVDYPSLSWPLVRQWLPLNLLFIAMLFSGFLALVHVSVPMVTIFKNIANLFTVIGDWYLFNEP